MSDPTVIVDHVLEKGGILRISGSDLVVDAPAGSLSADTIEAIRRNKPKILDLIIGKGGCITPPIRAQQRNTSAKWIKCDWRAFFDERAGISEIDGGLPRPAAEARAYECCVVKWLNHNPAPSSETDRCSECGEPITEPIDSAFHVYGLALEHKHVPEIARRGGLTRRPLLMPSVGRFHQGMIVQVPLLLGALPGAPTPAELHAILADHYRGCQFVSVADASANLARLDPECLNGTNELRLYVFGNAEHGQAVIAGVLDNLGKGASGQAVQNLNLMLGLDEAAGLAPT